MLVPIRPGDEAYINHVGPTFVSQDQNDNGNIAYFEITSEGDEILFSLRDRIAGLENPVITLHTQWGPTDFDLVDDIDGETIISEQSGFDNDTWLIQVSGRSGRFSLTNFSTGDGVDGTQAAWLPYVGVADMKV